MRVLVIPDVHLKPEMFERAAELMKIHHPDRAVCLMDLPDQWNQQLNFTLYEQTYDAAIRFEREYPDTLWCWGNHDICYVWDKRESGYSIPAAWVVREKVKQLEKALPDTEQLAFIHRIDDVLFMHGGLGEEFVRTWIGGWETRDIDDIISEINRMGEEQMWTDNSPIWLRPQDGRDKIFRRKQYLQVVGHTPVRMLYKRGNVISTDVFSTYSDGRNIGSCLYLIINTETHEFESVW